MPGRIDPHRPGEPPAIAAGHACTAMPRPAMNSSERQGDRRLAGAAGDQIADANHRHRRAVRARKGATQRPGAIPGRAERRQQPGGEPRRRAQNQGRASSVAACSTPRLAAARRRCCRSRGGSERVEPGRETLEHRVENAEPGGGDPLAAAARARRAAGIGEQRATPRRARLSASVTVSAAPAAASAAAIAAQLLISGPCRTAQPSRAASNGLCPPFGDQRSADKGDPGQAVESARARRACPRDRFRCRRRSLRRSRAGRRAARPRSISAIAAPRAGWRGAMIVSRPGCSRATRRWAGGGDFLLAGMRAGREPDRTRSPICAAQRGEFAPDRPASGAAAALRSPTLAASRAPSARNRAACSLVLRQAQRESAAASARSAPAFAASAGTNAPTGGH